MEDPDAQAESGLTTTDQRLLTGIFEYKDKRWVGAAGPGGGRGGSEGRSREGCQSPAERDTRGTYTAGGGDRRAAGKSQPGTGLQPPTATSKRDAVCTRLAVAGNSTREVEAAPTIHEHEHALQAPSQDEDKHQRAKGARPTWTAGTVAAANSTSTRQDLQPEGDAAGWQKPGTDSKQSHRPKTGHKPRGWGGGRVLIDQAPETGRCGGKGNGNLGHAGGRCEVAKKAATPGSGTAGGTTQGQGGRTRRGGGGTL